MAVKKIEIYYLGLKQGISEQSAIDALIQLLNIENDKARTIVRNTHCVLSSGLLETKAQQYLKAFSAAGLDVIIKKCSNETTDAAEGGSPEIQYRTHSQPLASSSSTVEFKGQGFEYFKIWIVNIFLTLITLGIYSAWAKVRNKQYFYGNTYIEGSSFRYTAKPIAILKGRLIALAFFAVYSVINNFNFILGTVLFLILISFIPWVIVRSLQFNARNSMFRNVRFNFDAKAQDAAVVFLLWPVLVPFTLGLITPFLWYKQSQFFVNHSSFGTANFKFNASAKDYYKVFFNILLVIIGLGIVAAILTNVLGLANFPELEEQFAAISIPIMMLIYLFIFAYATTALGNLFFNATTIKAHGFSAKLQLLQMAWLYFSNTLGIVLTLGLFIPWAQVRIAKYRSECLTLNLRGTLSDFVNAEKQHVNALGEQVGDVFDMDVSIL